MSLADCPFQTATNVAGVSCTAGICGITCKGETYDVNGDASDGCEIAGACPVGNGTMLCPVDDHNENVAASVGSFSCTDSDSTQDLTGTIPSDARDHAPAIDGFVAATGGAPNFFQIDATGGTFCQDDANFTLTMSAPTKQLACYVLTLITDNNGAGQTCTTDATGSCSISNGSGSYKDNSTIYVEVSKAPTCTAMGFPDDGTFAITGHL